MPEPAPSRPLNFVRLPEKEMALRSKAWLEELSRRRSVRHFSSDPFPLGVLDDSAEVRELNPVAIQVQKGHIQALEAGAEAASLLEVSERDRLRASFLRRHFG